MSSRLICPDLTCVLSCVFCSSNDIRFRIHGSLDYKLTTNFCVNWAFLIGRGTRLKHERSEGFKASRAIRKAQFTQKRVAYKILLFETTSLKLPNLLKMVSHLLLTVLTNFSRPVRNVTLNVLSRATVRYLLILL
jgi:hypothetical protein